MRTIQSLIMLQILLLSACSNEMKFEDTQAVPKFGLREIGNNDAIKRVSEDATRVSPQASDALTAGPVEESTETVAESSEDDLQEPSEAQDEASNPDPDPEAEQTEEQITYDEGHDEDTSNEEEENFEKDTDHEMSELSDDGGTPSEEVGNAMLQDQGFSRDDEEDQSSMDDESDAEQMSEDEFLEEGEHNEEQVLEDEGESQEAMVSDSSNIAQEDDSASEESDDLTDSDGAESDKDEADVLSDDEEEDYLKVVSKVLWPPNNKFRQFELVDLLGKNDLTACNITGISVEEKARDGKEILVENTFSILNATQFEVQASRSGGSTGRLYSVSVKCHVGGEDLMSLVHLFVPHSKGDKA